MVWSWLLGLEALVYDVADGLGHGAERRRRLNPTHSAGHRDGYQLAFSFIAREDEREAEAPESLEEEAVEAILDVVFGRASGPEFGVGVAHRAQEARQGSPKLHGFRRCVRNCGLVYGQPVPGPGVVAEEAWLAIAFVLDCGRREHDLF